MANLAALISACKQILQDAAYTDQVLTDRINEAVKTIAAGMLMPTGLISPPLPDLYKYDTILTGVQGFVSLPADYQRNVFNVVDNTGYKIDPPVGGDYYAFQKFLKQISDLRLVETGEVYRVVVKGEKMFYQGIPSAPWPIGVHYYRYPVDMAADADTPDGIPEYLQLRLVRHYVCKELYGEQIEDGQDNTGIGTKYHSEKFIEAMNELIAFVGIDAEPQYYGTGDWEDRGIVD